MTAPMIHPTWCDRIRCEAILGGSHSARPFIIERQGPSTSRVALRLWTPAAGEPAFVELAVGDHATGQRLRVDLSIVQAARIRQLLSAILLAAGGAR